MIELIPAIDLIDGKCVRLVQGDFNQKQSYAEDPIDVAKRFEDIGLKRLHVVDLDGAKAGVIKQYKVLEKIVRKTALVVDFGGGVTSDDQARIAFESGAAIISVGSLAVKERDTFARWLKEFTPQKVILSADVRDEKIKVSGWKEDGGVDLWELLAHFRDKGLLTTACTDIAKDGMLTGPSVALYKKILEKEPTLKVIASGGVSGVKDIEELHKEGIHGVIIGKALYEGRIKLSELKAILE